MTYKELMYEWIKSDTKHPIFSVDEMLSLSDFADWLDSRADDTHKDARITKLEDLLKKSHYGLCKTENDFWKLDKEINEALQKEEV